MRRLVPVALVIAFGLIGCIAAASAPLPSSVERPAVEASPVRRVRLPPVDGRADYQLGGPYTPVTGVRIVTRDRLVRPVPDRYSICYVNAFQTQPEEGTWWRRHHPELLVTLGGRPLADPDWPGEYLLDTSTAVKRSRLAGIVGGWVDGCARAGYQAVEPDNLDSFTRSRGRLTRAGNLAFAELLAVRAHRSGLAIAQKNTAELTRAETTTVGFDFAVAEECQVHDECDVYTERYGRHVIEIEYTDNPRRFYSRACAARGARISIILRDRDVVPRGAAGYRYEAC